MSSSSRAYKLLCHLYRLTIRNMRLMEARALFGRVSQAEALPVVESLEPRLLLAGNPLLDVSTALDHGYAGVEYTLNATATTASGDAGDDIASWIVDWGDGNDPEVFVTNELTPVLTHTYADSFAYNIVVTVVDAEGHFSTAAESGDDMVTVSILDTITNFGSATQSSISTDSDAANAIDGDTGGLLANASITTEDTDPWWQVDLNVTYDIAGLNIWNVDGAEAASQTDFWVFITTEDPSSYTLADLTADEQPDYVVYRQQVAGQAGQPTTLDLPEMVQGQFVRVQLAGETTLYLAEVEIVGLSYFQAVDDSGITTDQDTPISVAAPGMLANDQGYYYDASLSVLTDPTTNEGLVTAWGTDGSFTYDPNGKFDSLKAGETATDTFRYTLTDGTNYAVADVTIEITGVNDAPVAEDAAFSVKISAANDVLVGTYTGTDVDNDDSLTYSIIAGNDAGIFAISNEASHEGKITVPDTSLLSIDDAPYTLTVQVTDSLGATATATVTINVDENQPPVAEDVTFTVKEDAANGTAVGTYAASDADDDTLTYSMVDSVFAINSTTGEITVLDNSTLDYATTPSYTLTVLVDDGVNDPVEATITINVLVNEAPVLADVSYTVKDYAADGVTVGTLDASDADDETLTYTILSGNTGDVFALAAETGEITVPDTSLLDASVTSSYTLTVQVEDASGATDTATVTITVEANNLPVANDATLTVKEYAANLSVVGTVDATDQDGQSLTYTITAGNGDGVFAINAETGTIILVNNSTLDYSTTPSYTLTVAVDDGLGGTDTATITVNVEPNLPPIVDDATFSIEEFIETGSVVGSVTASDSDGDTLSYAIAAGNDDGVFAINAATGQITIANADAMDFAVTQSYTLTVEVSDGENAPVSATVTVDVVENQPPVVQHSTFLVRDNAANFTIVGSVTATDPEGDSITTFAISDDDGSDGAFEIDAETGQIYVADRTKLDTTVKDSYEIEIQVTDEHGNSGFGIVTINISGQNSVPVIELDDKEMSYTTDTLSVTLPTSDAEGDPITYEAGCATITHYDPDYDLKTELGLVRYNARYDDYRGTGRKYVVSDTGTWYFILPDGKIYAYLLGTFMGTVDVEYYTDPTALIALDTPEVPDVATPTILGNVLTIDPAAGYTGTFLVEVTGNDGKADGTGSFTVTVVNNAPVIDNISDVSVSHTAADPATVVLGANQDADGEDVTFTCVATNTSADAIAYNLKTELGLVTYLPKLDNRGATGRKWLKDAAGHYFYIMPNGELFQYRVAGKIGDVALEYYDDPQLLIDLTEPTGPDVTFIFEDIVTGGVDKTQVDIVIGNADFEGTFSVEVTATSGDGEGEIAVTDTFTVGVTNDAPVIETIADQDLSAADEPVEITLGDATDADGETVTYSYTLQDYQPAYDLKTELGLKTYYPKYDNLKGITRKLIRAADKQWYYIVPSGEVYNYKTGVYIDQIGTEYYDNPQDLIDAQPNPAPEDVFISLTDQTMTLTPADANFDGTFTVELTATDESGKTSTYAFQVSIIDHAPVINEVGEQIVSYRDNPQQAVVILGETTDADNQAVTFSVEFTYPASEAWQLKEELALATYVSKYDNIKKLGEKWFRSATGVYYYILETGEVFQNRVAVAKGQIDTAYYDDPQSLLDMEEPSDLNVIAGWADVIDGDVTNRQLTVTVQNASYLGTVRVNVTAVSGEGDAQKTSTYSFDVTVKNSVPVWETTASYQTVSEGGSTTVTYLATDFDSADSIIYSASLNTAKAGAYELESRLQFIQYRWWNNGNLWRQGEHVYKDAIGYFYGILPDGLVLRYGRAGSVQVGQVDPAYYDDPWALFYESEIYAPEGVQLVWNGGQLTVTTPEGFTGTFLVDVEATDGENVITHSFYVTVY